MKIRILREQKDECRHFTGIGNNADGRGECAANVKYDDVMKSGARMIALPCFHPERDNMPADGVWPTCDKCSFKTPAELDAEVIETERNTKEFTDRLMVVRPAILKHANWQERQLSEDDKFDGVTPKYDRKDARGKFSCPICTTGDLHYSISSPNGHVHAHCTTQNCVSWME